MVDVYAELGIGWVLWDGEGIRCTRACSPRVRSTGSGCTASATARPMVHAVDAVRVVPDPASPAAVAALVYSLPALGPFCYGCPAPRAGALPSRCRLDLDWRPGDVTVRTEAPADALIVLDESRSLGWAATVDGRPVRIYPINEAFQGVIVPAGRHVVRWRFASPGFFPGLAVGGVGVAVIGLAPWWFRRRRSATGA